MALSDHEKDLIRNSWGVARKDIVPVGIELFRRFFEANPDYKNFFPFRDLNTWEEIKADKRLKLHAGRVTSALSKVVDNLDNAEEFNKTLQELMQSHKKRDIKVEQFENLRTVLMALLRDSLGPELMNAEACVAWNKAYDVIVNAYTAL